MLTKISIIILTFNEEANIKSCLESVRDLSDDIFIVDSYSTDKTLEIAREYSAKIYQNAWVNWAHQRNWALDNLPLAYEWVLFLDADERLTDELRKEIAHTLERPDAGMAGYLIKRNYIFMGRWLKHGGYQSDYILRLVKKDKTRSVCSGAREYMTLEGETGRLRGQMIHEDQKDLGVWIDKQNKLALMEAKELLRIEGNKGLTNQSILYNLGKMERFSRIWLREKVWIKIPLLLRPFFYFFYRYVVQLGFLDGKEGFIYFFLHGLWYHMLIDAKYLELKRRAIK